MNKADIRKKNAKAQQALRDRKKAEGCKQVLVWINADNVETLNELIKESGKPAQQAKEEIINNLISGHAPKIESIESIVAKQKMITEREKQSEQQLSFIIED